MAKELVTVRTFGMTEEAHAFRNLLEAAGVPAFVEDEALVGWLWHYANAVGGIKVQVAEEDVERAREIVAEQPISVEDLKAAALAEPPEISEECSEGEEGVRSGAAEDDIPPELPGDMMVRRALLAALLGIIVCPPLPQFYSLWVLLRLALSDHQVSPAANWKQTAAFVIDVLGIITSSYLYFGWWLR